MKFGVFLCFFDNGITHCCHKTSHILRQGITPPVWGLTKREISMSDNNRPMLQPDASGEDGKKNIITNDLFGRRTIFSSVETLTEENIIDEITSALVYHIQNLFEEERLYWYRRGYQPILERTKERNTFVLNKVIENHCEEIVSFKDGYFQTQPSLYKARNSEVQDEVEKLNEYLYRSGKLDADTETVDWFHTVGLGYIMVEPNRDDDADEVPFYAYALRPMQAFVVRSMKPGNRPVYAANVVTADKKCFIDVWTKERLFRLEGSYDGEQATIYPDKAVTAVRVVSTEPNIIGEIPIIEYKYNATNMAAAEPVIGLLDTINNVRSNQSDGIEQFIQSLLVITNADLEEDETASSIKKKGMMIIRSTSELAAKVEMLSEQLDQTQTQKYIESLLQNMFAICGMPNRNEGGSSYNTTGAAVLASYGWYQADAYARNTEDLFKKSNRDFDRIILKILKDKKIVTDLTLNDFELHFVRNETANIQSKAQAFQTLMSAGLHPELAMAKSGISNDPVADVKMSEPYLKLVWGDPDNPMGTTEIMQDGTVMQSGGSAEDQGGNGDTSTSSEAGGHAGETYIEGYWQRRS